MTSAWILAGLAIAGSATAAVPTGVVIGRGGFATILRAPPSPTRDVKSARPTYNGPYEWYAQENGISLAEAKKRNGEFLAFRPTLDRLVERLRKHEPDNFVSVRMNHQPDWSYTLFFKRDPEATLRRYSVNPRVRAAKADYTEAELKALADPWVKRFSEAGIMGAYGFDTIAGKVSMMMQITEPEYRAVALARNWGTLPGPLQLSFPRAPDGPRVDPKVARYLRGFASESRSTGVQMEAGYSGRVVLDDGCLRLAGEGRSKAKGPLVVFHRETGIGLDEQGYLAAIDRRTGKAKGRIGERWGWAGPNPATMFDGLEQLKAACGDGPVINVGNPESEARFLARYPRAR